MAKVLHFLRRAFAPAVQRLERADLELTAIIEPARKNWERQTTKRSGLAMYRFGVDTMEEHSDQGIDDI